MPGKKQARDYNWVPSTTDDVVPAKSQGDRLNPSDIDAIAYHCDLKTDMQLHQQGFRLVRKKAFNESYSLTAASQTHVLVESEHTTNPVRKPMYMVAILIVFDVDVTDFSEIPNLQFEAKIDATGTNWIDSSVKIYDCSEKKPWGVIPLGMWEAVDRTSTESYVTFYVDPSGLGAGTVKIHETWLYYYKVDVAEEGQG